MRRSGRVAPLDRIIGRNLRYRRRRAGLGTAEIGRFIGVSRQQVTKFEAGLNCIAASQLYRIAAALRVPFRCFFRFRGRYLSAVAVRLRLV